MSEGLQGLGRHIVALGILGVLVAVMVVALSVDEVSPFGWNNAWGALRELNPQLVTEKRAPDFELPDRNGALHRLADYQRRPVLLNFWSIDCPPCLQELPSLSHLAEQGRKSGEFSVITVSVDESWEKVSRLFPERTTPPLILFDPERSVVEKRYGTKLFPETFLIDGDGQIRARFDGPRDWMSQPALRILEDLRGS